MPNDSMEQASYLHEDGSFDSSAFMQQLDTFFNSEQANEDIETYLLQALADAENAGDNAGLLTVLNEVMGFYRSRGRHEDNMWMIQRSLELAAKMQLEGTEAWITTLINAATGLRAAGRYEQAEDLYQQALASAEKRLAPSDRKLAALHNNLSMLYSDTGRPEQSSRELEKALAILTGSSPNPEQDIDLASTHANLALSMLTQATQEDQINTNQLLDTASEHAAQALRIYQAGHLVSHPHYASALASYAQVAHAQGAYSKAAAAYQEALNIISLNYGQSSDAYRITSQNLKQALGDAQAAGQSVEALDTTTTKLTNGPAYPAEKVMHQNQQAQTQSRMTGLKLARAYWEQYGKPLLENKYPEYVGRIAAGLVGHGSECYGFDDEFSQDHDYGPGFCLWLTREDYDIIGDDLQADYNALPSTFMGYGPRQHSVRAKGSNKRVGVFEIGDFFASITGFQQAPPQDAPHEWMLVDEATLAAATNGEVFADPLGAFLQTRQGFQSMPDDVRFSLISRRLGMMSQSGQYNFRRMIDRGDGPAAWLSISEFTKATASLMFLINNPLTVGYLPYYKWQFAALREISGRIATRLSQVPQELETLLQLASAACFGGTGFGEGGRGAAPSIDRIQNEIDLICQQTVEELRAEGLTTSPETFLEWQRPYIEAHITSNAPILHSL